MGNADFQTTFLSTCVKRSIMVWRHFCRRWVTIWVAVKREINTWVS